MRRVKTETLQGAELKWAFRESRKPYFEPPMPYPGDKAATLLVLEAFGRTVLIPYTSYLGS